MSAGAAGPPPEPTATPTPTPELARTPTPEASASSRRSSAAGRFRPLILVGLLLGVLALLSEAYTRGPQGPASSSYATSAKGFAAWAELLARSGHVVRRLRTPLARASLDPRETLVVLDPDALLHSEAQRLAADVRAGGRLLIGGTNPSSALPALVPDPPRWSSSGERAYAPAAGAASTPFAALGQIASAGAGKWTSTQGARVLLAGRGGSGALLLGRDLARGTIELLADASPVQNRLITSRDDAAFALALAGAPRRPVTFVESVHGYGSGRGLAAFPARWWVALAGFALAGSLWAIARGRRLGPPEPASIELSRPPRSAYVDALALLLRRSADQRGVAARLAAAAVREIDGRSPPGALASDDGRAATMRRMGLSEVEISSVLDPSATSAGPGPQPDLLSTVAGVLSRLRAP